MDLPVRRQREGQQIAVFSWSDTNQAQAGRLHRQPDSCDILPWKRQILVVFRYNSCILHVINVISRFPQKEPQDNNQGV